MPKKQAPPAKKQKTSSGKTSNANDVVFSTKSKVYTRAEIAELTPEDVSGLATRQDNCRFFVHSYHSEPTYGEDRLTVCIQYIFY